MLKLQLFGTGQVFYYDRPLAGFPNRQCHRLLCYLILNRHHLHHRERLAAVFWGERSTAVSRKYLRDTLWRLRNVLQSAGAPVGEYLLITEDSVSFLDSGRYWLDVEDFETTTTHYQDLTGQQLTPDQAAHLKEAVDLYVGDLLEGIYEDWCLYERERLRLLHLNALNKLVAFHEFNGTYERGLACGKQILALDPTREKVHRQMMRLYWLLEEPDEALAQYKCCLQVLHQELGIRPMERTQFLYKQMVRNQFDPATWPIQRDDFRPEPINQDQSVQALVKHALQNLNRVQAMAEETRAELERVERLISQTLSNGEGV